MSLEQLQKWTVQKLSGQPGPVFDQNLLKGTIRHILKMQVVYFYALINQLLYVLLILLKMSAGDACQLEEAVAVNSQFCSRSIRFAEWWSDFLELPEDLSLANKPNSHFQHNHQERAKPHCCKITFEKGPSVFI